MSATHEQSDARRLRIETVTQPSSVWILLRGEGDLAAAAELETALGAVRVPEGGSVHLHVGELGFVDVGTVRLLAYFARRTAEAGHAVMTCHPAPMLRRVATLLDAQVELGLLSAPLARAG